MVAASFKRLGETLRDIRQYRELFKYLIAFLIYNDGIGTIIGVAAIYGAELGFGSVELILALLLVQFVGIPYSLIFGRLPSPEDKRRPFFLAFILFNLIALPLVGIAGTPPAAGRCERRAARRLSPARPLPPGKGSIRADGARLALHRRLADDQPVPAETWAREQDLTARWPASATRRSLRVPLQRAVGAS